MSNDIECNEPVVATVASFRNFPSEDPIKDSVVIFWESHTNNPTDKERIRSTIDLISKRFDLTSCEKYEVRTGYLSRYNYLAKTLEESSVDELQEAVIKGEEEQTGWIERCSPNMPTFKQINWPECVSPRKNPHFAGCREKLRAKIEEDEKFFKAYRESADAYAIKRHTNPENGFSYLVEENAWIMSLPLLHPNKKIYIIHVGNVTDSTLILFSEFEYLKKSALLLFPSFTHETFASIGDFKIEYENKNKFGYFIDGIDFAKNNTYLEDYAKNIKVELLTERAEKELLSNIIAQLPGHIYWMNIKGRYIGCNDLQAEHLGLKSRDQIIGRTVFDLLPTQDALKHNNINKLVIERGRNYSGKEKVSTKEGIKTYLSTKVPLENTAGERVGLLGVSVDITDRENATALQKQNEARKFELEKQKELQKLSESVAHDIRTPLMVLLYMANNVSLSEKEHTAIRNAVTGIERIINELIDRYEGEQTFTKEKYTCIQTTLQEIIKSVRYQHGSLDIEFKYIEDNSAKKYYFVEGDHSDFSRMMINLINNAVEAVSQGRHGIIEVGFNVENNNVVIFVKDNGKGMPPDVVQKIMNGQFIVSTKEHGHGFGTRQVFDNVKAMNGKLTVTSKENVGTEFKLTFEICETPQWFSDKITLRKGDIVVVLDDDPSIFEVWKRIFSIFGQDILVKYFTKGNDAIGFIKATKSKSPNTSIFLIADYELRGQSINGVDVIEQTEMQKRSLLVTSLYTSKIKEFNEKSETLKIFPKTEGVEKIKITLE